MFTIKAITLIIINSGDMCGSRRIILCCGIAYAYVSFTYYVSVMQLHFFMQLYCRI